MHDSVRRNAKIECLCETRCSFLILFTIILWKYVISEKSTNNKYNFDSALIGRY